MLLLPFAPVFVSISLITLVIFSIYATPVTKIGDLIQSDLLKAQQTAPVSLGKGLSIFTISKRRQGRPHGPSQ